MNEEKAMNNTTDNLRAIALPRLVRPLPCFPCPHNSVCCRWGTYLSVEEASVLLAEFGKDFVYWNTDDEEWRTQVKNGRCAFWEGGVGYTLTKHTRKCAIYSRGRMGGTQGYPQRMTLICALPL